MPSVDVVVVGAGLSGLVAAIELAGRGARVEVIARGHAATHWTAGGFDVAAPDRAETSAEGLEVLAARPGHPYAVLADSAPPALAGLRATLAEEGLSFDGSLEDPLRPVPTAIGGTRRVAILPDGQAAALAPWQANERLVICGPAGFKDFWPAAVAASLGRAAVWGTPGEADRSPDRVDAVVVELPGLADRRNLNALDLARFFDDPAWRREALGRIAGAAGPIARRGPLRIGFPAVLGLADHAAVLDDAARLLPGPIFEIPLVPPSIPGIRLFRALRAALRRRGGGLMVGEPVIRVDVEGRLVTGVAASAAVRERRLRTGALVLATGGIAGGGIVGHADGRLEEPLLELPVEAPSAEAWLAEDPSDPAGHPLEGAGIRTDHAMRPVDRRDRVVLDNVGVVGSLLAGQRYLVERCGDGVAVASGARAAATLGEARAGGNHDAAAADAATDAASARRRRAARKTA